MFANSIRSGLPAHASLRLALGVGLGELACIKQRYIMIAVHRKKSKSVEVTNDMICKWLYHGCCTIFDCPCDIKRCPIKKRGVKD